MILATVVHWACVMAMLCQCWRAVWMGVLLVLKTILRVGPMQQYLLKWFVAGPLQPVDVWRTVENLATVLLKSLVMNPWWPFCSLLILYVRCYCGVLSDILPDEPTGHPQPWRPIHTGRQHQRNGNVHWEKSSRFQFSLVSASVWESFFSSVVHG